MGFSAFPKFQVPRSLSKAQEDTGGKSAVSALPVPDDLWIRRYWFLGPTGPTRPGKRLEKTMENQGFLGIYRGYNGSYPLVI